MKQSKLNEIQGVLVTANRSDLAEALGGRNCKCGCGGGKDCKCKNKPTVVTNADEDLEYNDHLKAMLNKMGRTFKDIKKLTKDEWKVIDDSWNGSHEAGKDGATASTIVAMPTSDVVETFIKSPETARQSTKSKNSYMTNCTTGYCLYSYDDVVAIRDTKGNLFLSSDKISPTTSKLINVVEIEGKASGFNVSRISGDKLKGML